MAVKVGVAYQRMLHFEQPAQCDAERVLNRPLAQREGGLSHTEARPLQNYMAHQVIR